MAEYHCPVAECDYTNAEGSVIAHAVGKKDEAHRGFTYQGLRGTLEPVGGSEPTGSRKAPTTASDGRTTVTPSMDEKPQSEPSEPTCPECGGHRWFPADGTEYEYGCADCSTESDWVVFD